MRTYEDYDESRNRTLVSVDIDNLEVEIKYHSLVVYDYGIYLAYAAYNLAKAKSKLDRKKKELSAEVRTCPSDYGIGPPDLKTAIEEWVASNAEVQELEDDVIEKKLIQDKLEAACDALDIKSHNIGRALKLFLRNYYADNPISQEEKRRIESFDYEETYDYLAEVMKKRKGGKNEV